MRIKLITILIAFSINNYSCNNKKDIQKTWISSTWTQHWQPQKIAEMKADKGKYSPKFLQHLDSIYNSEVRNKLVYQFEEDSVTYTQFNTSAYGFQRKKVTYQYKNNSIFFEKGQAEIIEDSVEKITANELILSNYDVIGSLTKNRIVLQPLELFNSSAYKDQLESSLNGNQIVIKEEDLKLTFNKLDKYGFGRITSSGSDNKWGLRTDDFWYLTQLDNELLLVIGHQVIHIKALQKTNIQGYIYGSPNKEITLEQIKQ